MIRDRYKLKIREFKVNIDIVPSYGSQCWTLASKLRKRIYGVYTRLLRMAQNISWKTKLATKNHIIDQRNQQIYSLKEC